MHREAWSVSAAPGKGSYTSFQSLSRTGTGRLFGTCTVVDQKPLRDYP